jgi:cold shock CspA family protein
MMTSWNSDTTAKRGRAMKGQIAQLSHGRFCGVIRASEGQNVFFHGRDLEGAQYNDVEIGRFVSFELIDDRVSGPRAARIRLAPGPSLRPLAPSP